MTQLQRVLVLSGLLSVWDQGGGGGGGGGAALQDHNNHHHHHHDLQQVTTNEPHLWMDAHLDAREREKNLVIPPAPPLPSLPPPSPSPSLLKQHTWPRGGGGGGDWDTGKSEDMPKKRKKEKEEKRNMQRRRKLHLKKLKRKIKEENKRRKRQMRLTNKKKGKRGSEGRPNIVLIVADDLGYNDVPWHNPDIHAPELQRLARQGIVLESHYVLPVCAPSRAALLTGRYPYRDGKQASFSPLSPTGLNTSLTLLPQDLQRLGYKTHLIGKWHLGYCSWAYTPTHRGFDSFYGYYLGSQGYYDRFKRVAMPHTRRERSMNRREKTNQVTGNLPPVTEESGEAADVKGWSGQVTRLEMKTGGGDGGGGRREGREVKEEALSEEEEVQLYGDGGYDFRVDETPLVNVTGVYSNDLYAARVEEVIRGHVDGGGGSPLFLLLSLQSTHGPLEAPPPVYLRRGPHPQHILNPARRTFHGMVAALDRVVGRLVRQLRRSGLYHNTLIVFTSDNGGNFRVGGNNFPLRGNKGSVYEGGTKGVSFLHSPLLPHVGHRYRGLMHLVDWRATLLHAARGPTHWPRRGAPPQQEEEEEEGEEVMRRKKSDASQRRTKTENEEEVVGKKRKKSDDSSGGTEVEEDGVVKKKRKRGEASLIEAVEEEEDNEGEEEEEEKESGKKRRGGEVRKRKRRNNSEEEQEEEEEEEDDGGDDGDDSMDMWGALLHNTPSPRTSFVYTLRKGPLRGAIRRRHWKLVVGVGGRYDGWVPPEDVGGVAGVGGYSWHTPTTRQRTHNRHLHPHHHYQQHYSTNPHQHQHTTPTTTTTTKADDVMLFNLRDDPLETTDLSSLYPEVVASLRTKLKAHARHSKHPHSPRDDPRGHPSLHGGFFSPGWCEPVV